MKYQDRFGKVGLLEDKFHFVIIFRKNSYL